MGNESLISNVDATQRGKVHEQHQNETIQVVQRDLTTPFNIHQTPQNINPTKDFECSKWRQ
jgi:hypothetical protein